VAVMRGLIIAGFKTDSDKVFRKLKNKMKQGLKKIKIAIF
jgi:hypothetical protein